MNILVINGSPKGKYSITLQTVHYWERLFPEHKFTILHVGQKIKTFEKDFSLAIPSIEAADLLLFSYPVYTFLVPSQLHRFIELMHQAKLSLQDKFATQLSTSKHFYDMTAHRFIEENVLDLGLKYIPGLSADMEDLLSEKGRKEAEAFFHHLLWAVKESAYQQKTVLAESNELLRETLADTRETATDITLPAQAQALLPKAQQKDVLILTDIPADQLAQIESLFQAGEFSSQVSLSNLAKMILRLRRRLPYTTRVISVADYPSGGCLGCFRCAVSENCVYKDGFDDYLRNNIQKADAIVYAASISCHSMGSAFKRYDDRNFCNGHRTVTHGMPVAYLLSGAYSKEHNLATVIEARAQTGGNFLAGVVSDEHNVNSQIDLLAKHLHYALEHHYVLSSNFWGVGGMKIFRDLIYQMRGMMRADHKFYKKRGIYDFPQKQWFASLKMYLVGLLLSNEKIVAKMGNKMNEGMLAPYKKLFDNMDKSSHRQ